MESAPKLCPSTQAPCAVRQSFAEIGDVFQVQTTCPDCGYGGAETVKREVAVEMMAAQEKRQIEARKAAEKAAETETSEK